MGCFYWHGNFSAIKINAIKNNDYKLFCLSRHTRLKNLYQNDKSLDGCQRLMNTNASKRAQCHAYMNIAEREH